LLLLMSLMIYRAEAQESSKYKDFPVSFGPSSVGRDFWFSFPANWDEPTAAQYYIRLYITSAVATQVRVWAGTTLRQTITTHPYDMVTVDLSPTEAQIFTRGDIDPVPNDQIYKKKAIHVEADDAIVVYGINRTSYTSDGMLLIPTNGLGREYIVASYAAVIGVTQELPSQFMITAPYNNTEVTVKQPMRSPNHPEGSTVSFTLDSGDVYSAMSIGYNGDMSGAEISASKPVAVTAGQNCAYIPNQLEFCCCDHLEEQMLPVSSWGTVYHGVSFATRKNGDIWRIYASQPDTKIKLNGLPYATLSGVGGQRGDGWIEYRAMGRELNEWTADKPIYVAQYNASQYYDNVVSDPFYLVMTPLEQYRTALVFSTPSNDFPRNFINLVADSTGYADIEIAPGGTNNWQPLSSYPGTGTASVFPTQIGGRTYLGVTIDIQPGVYQMRGTQPFAGYLYGFSDYDSYGYPLSVALADIEIPDTSGMTLEKDQDCFGGVTVTATDPGDEAMRSNLSTIDMDPKASYNYALDVERFEAGATRTLDYTMHVLDKNKPARAIVYLSDGAGNMTVDTVTYTPTIPSISSSLIDYGTVSASSSVSRTITLSNMTDQTLNISEVVLQKGNAGFEVIHPTGAFTLGPAGSATASIDVDVKFTAATSAMAQDSVGLRTSCGVEYLALVRSNAELSGVDVRLVDAAGKGFTLDQNQPNPSSRLTQINYGVGASGKVQINLYDAKGELVRALVDGYQKQGRYELTLDVSDLPSGSYYYTLVSGTWSQTKTLSVVR